jgi:hypothetical protein
LVALVRAQYWSHGRDPEAGNLLVDRESLTLKARRNAADGTEEYFTVHLTGHLLRQADLQIVAEEFYLLAYPPTTLYEPEPPKEPSS